MFGVLVTTGGPCDARLRAALSRCLCKAKIKRQQLQTYALLLICLQMNKPTPKQP